MPAGFGWFSLVLWAPLSCDFIAGLGHARQRTVTVFAFW
jgi:hypothetical protein